MTSASKLVYLSRSIFPWPSEPQWTYKSIPLPPYSHHASSSTKNDCTYETLKLSHSENFPTLLLCDLALSNTKVLDTSESSLGINPFPFFLSFYMHISLHKTLFCFISASVSYSAQASIMVVLEPFKRMHSQLLLLGCWTLLHTNYPSI